MSTNLTPCCTYLEILLSGTYICKVGLNIADESYNNLQCSALRYTRHGLETLTAQRSIVVKKDGAHNERIELSLGLYKIFA